MNEDIKQTLVRDWLVKAHRDLLSARQLATASCPLLDTASYHCQQAAEKAVKAFLVFHDIRFGKTHDLGVLLSQAADVDPAFASCLEDGQIVTPFATVYRYPGEYLEPSPEEYEEALAAAVRIVVFVVKKLPEVTLPADFHEF